jgi:hypothetical protein
MSESDHTFDVRKFEGDHENYPLLRPVLLEIRLRYPDYNDPDPEFKA